MPRHHKTNDLSSASLVLAAAALSAAPPRRAADKAALGFSPENRQRFDDARDDLGLMIIEAEALIAGMEECLSAARAGRLERLNAIITLVGLLRLTFADACDSLDELRDLLRGSAARMDAVTGIAGSIETVKYAGSTLFDLLGELKDKATATVAAAPVLSSLNAAIKAARTHLRDLSVSESGERLVS